MRLTSLRLERYGPFEDLQVRLTAEKGQLNLIYAPNGAGKSVFRAALADLLFGIRGQSPMGFRFDYKGIRLTAEAEAADGTKFSFGRRKGQGNTLIDLEGREANPGLLAGHLGTTNREALEQLFALDTERLRDGGERMLRSDGLVADALLSAGGLSHAHGLRRELEQRADGLAPARKSAGKPFYVAADRFVAARASANKALLKPDAWNSQLRELQDAETALAQARRRAGEAVAARTRLERLRRTRPTVAALDAAAAWLHQNPDAPVLAPTMRARLDAASADVWNAGEKVRAEASRRDLLAAELDAIPRHEALLRQAAVIDLLAEHSGGVVKNLKDLPTVVAELGQVGASIAHKQRSLGNSVASPASLIPPRAVLMQTRTLIREHGGHVGACRAATKGRDEYARLVHEKHDARAQSPARADTAELHALSEQIRAEGDPAVLMREAERRSCACQAAFEHAFAELPYWRSGDAALRGLILEPLPSFDRTHVALVKAEAALAREAEAQLRARAQLDDAHARLSAIVGSVVVPDREAVAEARKRRQGLWALVARRAFDADAPEATKPDLLKGISLALAYEHAVVDADAIADRRADESALVEQARGAERDVAAALSRMETADLRYLASLHARDEGLAAWQALLPEALPSGWRLDDVRGFVNARSRVLERWEELEVARENVAALGARHAGWRARLAGLLQNAGPSDLPGLLADAQRTLKAADTLASQVDRLDAAIALLEPQLRDATEKCRQADHDHAAWQEHWAGALRALGRPDGEAPSTTEDILTLLSELDTDLTRAATLEQRIDDMGAENKRFAQQVAVIVQACGQAAADEEGAEAALGRMRSLRADVEIARQHEAKGTTLRNQLEQASRQAAALFEFKAVRQAHYAEVLLEIGSATQAEAEIRVAQAEERALHQDEMRRAELRLREDADGVTIDILRGELAVLNTDDVTRELYTVAAEANAAQEAVAHHSAQAALLRQTLAQKEAETTYTDAITIQQEAVATADRVLREALVARLAACLLGNAMDAVEKQGSPEMLKRIGIWFARLTADNYPDVGVEQTEDGMALVLTEAGFPHEPKRVTQLSEGTRDQLYLALRLAAIETHPAALPFVADDILQTSDDRRAEAALRALLEISARNQVILLTHHQHILLLAQRNFPGAVHVASLAV